MDVDGGALNSDQHDLEQSLLQEFSRMGTRDKEDLINQMQKLLGPGLNYNTASFFLDMNNWNIQEATCCYLEFQPTILVPPSSAPAPSPGTVTVPLPLPIALPLPIPMPSPTNCQMELIFGKPKTPDPHLPGINIQWGWVVRNSGTEDWPEGCYVRPVESSNSVVDVPTAIKPRRLFIIQFALTTPTVPGHHNQMYRMFTPQGEAFGDELWVNLLVQEGPATMQCMDQPLDENMC